MEPDAQLEWLLRGEPPWLAERLMSDPEFAAMLGRDPSQAEMLAVSLALLLAGFAFPAAAFVFAAANLRRGRQARPLFVSALLSSGLSLIAGVMVTFLPGARLDRTMAGDWRSFLLIFLYAWALLDFWRGARITGARPRAPAFAAGLCLAAATAAAIMVAT
jgi:hypothetical protein